MNVINVIKLGGLIVFGWRRVAVVMAALIAASKRSPISRQGSSSVGCLLRQIFPARELKAAFAAIAADNLLDGDVLVELDLVPDRDGDRLAQVFQGLFLPGRIVP